MANWSIPERLWAKIRKTENCWLWTGKIEWTGYARVRYRGTRIVIHRLFWQWDRKRTLPPGQLVLHHCDVRHCVRPSHLWMGTHKENTADMFKKGRQGAQTGSGEANAAAVLKLSQVIEIKKLLKTELTVREIAQRVNVDRYLIYPIRRGDNWGHVTVP